MSYNYYIIDDKASDIVDIMIRFDKVKEIMGGNNFSWIDENGEATKKPPVRDIEFLPNPSEEFLNNIQRYSKDNSVFLIDMALNSEDNKQVRETYLEEGRNTFKVDAAGSIIKALKDKSSNVKIVVVSGTPQMITNHDLWKKHMPMEIENHLNDIRFIPLEYIYGLIKSYNCLSSFRRIVCEWGED